MIVFFFFFQAEDGIRDHCVTGVQTCALPIFIIVILLSMMTWVPGLLLFGLQGYLEGWAWMADHSRIVTGVFFGAWIWILVIALLALALSAWVKWKPAAGALLFGVFFVASGFGGAIN